jgi:hypothetical protein
VKDRPPAERQFTVLTRVRCLECGSAYAKPARGGTFEKNPGCPRCGYIGWIPASLELMPAATPHRSVADLRLRRAARQR